MTVHNILQQNSVSTILIENSKGNSENYRTLCALLTDSNNISEENLLTILSQLRECIGLLNQRMKNLVQKILNLNWATISERILKEHAQFLVSLAVGQVFYLEHVLRCVVKKFIPNLPPDAVADDVEKLDTKLGMKFNRIYTEAHFVIQCILRISPMCQDKLFHILSESFPFMRRHSIQIRDYVRNLLCLSNSASTIRIDILRLIVEELLRIDTVCSKESSSKIDEIKLNATDEVFSMDCDLDESARKNQLKFVELNEKLDNSMRDIFEYINSRSRDLRGNISEELVDLYQDFFGIFERIVLPVFSCSNVQFVWLYVCSLRSDLADHFLNYLWQKVQEPSAECILRQAAACYLAGYLARAEYVNIKQCKIYLERCVGWLHLYVNNEDSSKRDSVSLHTTFYSVCQAVFYVITFRHKELLESRKGHDFLKNLNLDRLVTCNLNPLKFCLETVVVNFASVSRTYQFAFCYTVMERNLRTAIYDEYLVGAGGSKSLTSKRLDCFFPFDPYGLEKSSSYITPIYRQYEDDEYVSKPTTSKTCRQTTAIETDDFLTDEFMSTSVENRTKNILMSYSVSPGFKHG